MRKLNGLDKYVIFSIAVVLIYTIAEFITSTITGVEKTTLSTCVYGFFAGEVVWAALIKIFKLKKEDKECDWREKMENDVSVADLGGDSTDI